MRGTSGRKRRHRSRAKITLLSLVPVLTILVLLVALIVYGRSPFPLGAKKPVHPTARREPVAYKTPDSELAGPRPVDPDSGYRAEIIAIVMALFIAIYLLPGNPQRVERLLFPNRDDSLRPPL